MTAQIDAQRPLIDRTAIPTHSFEWGAIKWLVTPTTTPGARLTFGEVLVMPGKGHSRHNHPDAEEILYILSGEGEQMVGDGEPFTVRAGDVMYIPAGVFHATLNTGWEPMRLIALYNPGGSELGLMELEDFREDPAGTQLGWNRA
jgi:oxalate decarboxylase/phosphoglucose isomerase-like protein (cupin superfamily)